MFTLNMVLMFYYHLQDTLNALEALAEYELKRSSSPEANLIAVFTVPGRNDILKLTLEKKKDKVETDLKVTQSIVRTRKYAQKYFLSFLYFLVSFVPEIYRKQHSCAHDRKRRCQAKSKFD